MCTFHPNINRSRPKKADGPVIVKGFGRFLELKELAKKIEEEKSARENRAFMIENSKYRSGNRTTALPDPTSDRKVCCTTGRRCFSPSPRRSDGDECPCGRPSDTWRHPRNY